MPNGWSNDGSRVEKFDARQQSVGTRQHQRRRIPDQIKVAQRRGHRFISTTQCQYVVSITRPGKIARLCLALPAFILARGKRRRSRRIYSDTRRMEENPGIVYQFISFAFADAKYVRKKNKNNAFFYVSRTGFLSQEDAFPVQKSENLQTGGCTSVSRPTAYAYDSIQRDSLRVAKHNVTNMWSMYRRSESKRSAQQSLTDNTLRLRAYLRKFME